MRGALRAALVMSLGASALVVAPSQGASAAPGTSVIEGWIGDLAEQPLEGMVVSLTTDPGFQQAHLELASTITDASGYYRFDTSTIEAPDTPAYLNVTDPEGVYGGRFLNEVELTTGTTIQFSAGLEPGGRVLGTVWSGNGIPVNGSCATVTDAAGNLLVPYAWPGTCTGWDGFYSLPTLPPGPWTVSFGTPNPSAWWDLPDQPFEVLAGETTVFDVTLPAPPSTELTGEIVDATTGEPLAGIKVGVFNVNDWGQPFEWRVFTEADGSFTMDLSGYDATGNPFRVDVIDESGTFASEFGYEVSIQPGYTEALGIALDPGATFTGTITDSTSGAPVTGACVVVEDLAGNPVIPSGYAPCTDASGTYQTLAVPPGEYQLRVSPPRRYYEQTSAPAITDIGATGVVDFSLDRIPDTLVSGVVTDAITGDPLAGISVRAALGADPYGEIRWAEATTSADGGYTVDVSEFDPMWNGGEPLQIGFIDRVGDHAPRFLQIQPQLGYVEALSVTMEPGGHITLHVIDTGGSPVPGACLSIPLVGWWSAFPWPFVEPWCTDVSGTFVSPGVPAVGPTEYSVFTNSNAYGDVYAQPISIGFGDNPLEVVLDAFDPQPLTGTVRYSDGSPAANAQVRVINEGNYYDIADIATTSPDGTYRATVRGGVYDVVAHGGDEAAFVGQVDITSATALDITLQPDPVAPITVSGHVSVPSGTTATVSVSCDSIPPFGGSSVNVGTDGNYTVTFEARRTTPCSWNAYVYSAGVVYSSLSVSRSIDVSDGTATVDLQAPTEFPVRVVDGSGLTIPFTGYVQLSGSVAFEDGATGQFSSSASTYFATTDQLVVPSYEPSSLWYSVNPVSAPSQFAQVDAIGLDHYDIVFDVEPVVVRGTAPLPAGWSGTVTLSCPSGYSSAPLNSDGTYEVTAGYSAPPVECQWNLQLSQSTSPYWSPISISRSVTVTAGGTALDLPSPRSFEIAVVDSEHQPVVADWITANVTDQLTFDDGVVAQVSGYVQGSGVSSMVIPVWTATSVSGSVSALGEFRGYTADTTVTDRYEVVFDPPRIVTISGTLAGLDNSYGYVSASCPSASNGVQWFPDGSYSISLWVRRGEICNWSLSANDLLTGASLSAQRSFTVDADSIVIDLAAASEFTVSALAIDGSPESIAWGSATLTGSVPFSDGAVGTFTSNGYAPGGTSSFSVRGYEAQTLSYSVNLASGEQALASGVDVTGLNAYTITVERILAEISGSVPLPDGWSASVSVACPGAYGYSPVDADGSYSISVATLADTPCNWTLSGGYPYPSGQLSVSRMVTAQSGPAIVDLDMPVLFEVAAVDEAGQPVDMSYFSLTLSGSVTFPDGAVGASTSIASGSGGTSILLPAWDPMYLSGPVATPWFYTMISTAVAGTHRYEVLVPAPTDVRVSGSIGLPGGWNGTIDLSCPTSNLTTAVGWDGTYAIDLQIVGVQDCHWFLRAGDGVTSMSISRPIDVGAEPDLDVSIPTLSLFTIEFVDQYGVPYPPRWVSGNAGGTVAFGDGSLATASSSFVVSNSSTISLAIGDASFLYVTGYGGDWQWIYEYLPVSGPTHTIVVTRPDLATVSGTVDFGDSYGSGYVTVSCPGGSSQAYVASWQPTYSLSVDASGGTDCTWSMSGGYPSMSVTRTLDLSSRSAVVDLSPPTMFSLEVVNAAGNPAFAWWITAGVTGTIEFGDGVAGTTSASTYGSGSTLPIPVWNPAELTYSVADGSSSVSGTVDVTGLTGYTVVLPDVVPPVTSVTGVFDGHVFTYGETSAPACSTTDDVGVATEAALTVTQIAGGSGVGDFVVTCSGATDFGGNAAAPAGVTYSIRYGLASPVFVGGSPVPAPEVNSIRRGERVTLRWFLYDIASAAVTDANAVTGVEMWDMDCTDFESVTEPPTMAGTAVSGLTTRRSGEFRIDVKTPRRAACTLVAIHLADATSIVVKLRSS